MSNYAISKFPTPVYNQDRGLEFIAFPGTKFLCQKPTATTAQVTTKEYPTDAPLYVDSRFLKQASHETPEREKKLPPVQTILKFMESLIGTRYLWGGNWAQGIPEILEFYPALSTEDDLCKGIDCSGLLFQATNGFTPRNTSELISYGKEISVDQEIKPLDMLVWKGHVIFVLNSQETIESRSGKGVVVSSFTDRYAEVCEKLRAEDKSFYLRRWYPDFLT